MMYYLKLIRPINLLVVALTLLLFRYCIIDVESYRLYDFLPYMKSGSFYILLLTTLFITAGGYVINDIYDVDTDQINKPEKIIVGKHIDDTAAFNFYLTLTGIGILGSFILMYTTQQLKISSIPIFVSVMLYLYASTFKRMALVGNIVVSLCAALPVILVSFYELRINDFDTSVVIRFTEGIGLAAIVYALFAFLTTLIREIIKDVQDMEGDDFAGMKTFPIVTNISVSKMLIVVVQAITLSILLFIAYFFLAASYAYAFYGTIGLLISPLLLQIAVVIWAKTPNQFKWASLIGKIHMVLGIATLLYFVNGTAPLIFKMMFNFVPQVLSSL